MNNGGSYKRPSAPKPQVNDDGTVVKPRAVTPKRTPPPAVRGARGASGGNYPPKAPWQAPSQSPRQAGRTPQQRVAPPATQQFSTNRPPKRIAQSVPQRPPQQRPQQPRPQPRPQQGQQRPPQQRPPQRPPQRTQPPRQQNASARPVRPPRDTQRSSGWAMPESSAVYTSTGKYYERADNLRRQSPPKNKRRRAKRPKGWLVRAVRSFVLTLLVTLVCVSAAAGIYVYRTFWSDASAASSEVEYTFGKKSPVTAGANSAYSDGVLYINFTSLSDWLGLSRVGNIGSLRFVVSSDTASAGSGHEEYTVFTEGSTTVEVNGAYISMEAESRIIGTDIWVPVSFVDNYISGITVKVSDKGDSVKVVEGDGTEKQTEASDTTDEAQAKSIAITFRLKKSDPIESVSYNA